MTKTDSQPGADCTFDGWDWDETQVKVLFDAFRQAEAAIWKFAAKYQDHSPEKNKLLARYHSQLKR